MKTVITLLALTISVNSFAGSFLVTSVSSALTSRTEPMKEEANQALANIQEFHATGELNSKLQKQVLDLQSQADLSLEEALDVISDNAEEILR